MSVVKRFVSGSVANWAKIIVLFVAQIAMVPIYIRHWGIETYGVWLAVNSLFNTISLINKGQQEYVGYEFLKLGVDKKEKISAHFSSGALIGLFLSFVQLLILYVLIRTDLLNNYLFKSSETNNDLLHQSAYVLLILGVNWLVNIMLSGLLQRLLQTFGYFYRMAWWGVLHSVLYFVAVPIVAVLNGGNMIVTALAMGIGSTIVYVFIYLDQLHLLKKGNIKIYAPSIRLGIADLSSSMLLSLKSILDNFRLEGIRLILTPMVGAGGVASFATLRTGANVALQGLATITSPLLPELMSFINKKDQKRFSATIYSIWGIVIFVLTPALIGLQLFVEPLYELWTNGELQYNPVLFSLLSIDVLLFAFAQPALSVIMGNNLLRPQILVSTVVAIAIFGGLYVLTPIIGINAAGLFLVIGEVIAGVYYRYTTIKWLLGNNLAWPRKVELFSFVSTLIAGAAIVLINICEEQLYKYLVFAITLVVLGVNFWMYYKLMPEIVKRKIRNLRNLKLK